MEDQTIKFTPGEVVVLTSGCYSDYGLKGFIVAIAPFNIEEQAQLFVDDYLEKEQKKGEHYYGYIDDAEDGLIAWLIRQELVIPVKYREFHLGDYGNLKDLNVKLPE